jgi:hypothetical protein
MNSSVRAPSFILSAFLLVAPATIYAMGPLYNILGFHWAESQVNELPMPPSSKRFASHFQDEHVGALTSREATWVMTYQTSAQRSSFVAFYHEALLDMGWEKGDYGYSRNDLWLEMRLPEHDDSIIAVTIQYTYDVRFDLRYQPWN